MKLMPQAVPVSLTSGELVQWYSAGTFGKCIVSIAGEVLAGEVLLPEFARFRSSSLAGNRQSRKPHNACPTGNWLMAEP